MLALMSMANWVVRVARRARRCGSSRTPMGLKWTASQAFKRWRFSQPNARSMRGSQEDSMDYGKIISLVISLLSGTGTGAGSVIVKALLDAIGAILKNLNVPASNMDVAWVQRALAKLGFDPGGVDGMMGPKTQAAVKAYQTARGLTADGWVGAETQAKLRQEAGDA